MSWRRNNCNILTPTLIAITAFLSRSPELLNRGPLWDMVLIPTSSLQLIWTLTAQSGVLRPPLLGASSLYSILSPANSNFLRTELYYCFTPTQFNLSTVKVTPLIPSTGCTCYLHRCIYYFDCSTGVNMQQKAISPIPSDYFIINIKSHGHPRFFWLFLFFCLSPPLSLSLSL